MRPQTLVFATTSVVGTPPAKSFTPRANCHFQINSGPPTSFGPGSRATLAAVMHAEDIPLDHRGPATAAHFHMPLPPPPRGRARCGRRRTMCPPSTIDTIGVFGISAIVPTSAPTTAAASTAPARPPNAGICGFFCRRGPAPGCENFIPRRARAGVIYCSAACRDRAYRARHTTDNRAGHPDSPQPLNATQNAPGRPPAGGPRVQVMNPMRGSHSTGDGHTGSDLDDEGPAR